MNRPFRLVAPNRLQIREGGGCLSVFGLPFFAAGVFLLLTVLGVVPVSNAHDLSGLARPMLSLMGLGFTGVGAALVLGRSWTTIDSAQRTVIKQWGLLFPLRERIVPLHGYDAVTLGFVEGDSDTSDHYPIALKAQIGPDLPLCTFTQYAQARECARAIAEHLQLEIEDASTDHAVRRPVGQIDVPLVKRAREVVALPGDVVRPSVMRSQVTQQFGEVTIVIPVRRLPPLVLAIAIVPIAIPLVIGPPLATFFRQSQTPAPVAWTFLVFLTLFFGILPAMTIVNALVRSRRGATIVRVSKQGLRIQQRGAWKTRTTASLDAADILDVDYSSRESSVASAQRAAEQQVLQSYPTASPSASPRLHRIMVALSRFATGKGVTVKHRRGLTNFGRGLEDEEVRYLHAVVRRALIE